MTCWPWSIPRGPRATLPTSTRTVSNSSKACEFHPSLSSTFNPRKLGFSELLEARERGGARSPARNREDTLTSSGGLKIKTNEAREAIGGITRKFWQIERPTFPDSSSYRIDLEAKKGEWKSGEEKLRKTRRRLILLSACSLESTSRHFPPPLFFRSPISSFLFIPRCEKKKKKRNGTRAVRRSSSLFNFPQIAVKFVCSRIEQISFQFGFFFSKKRIVRLSFLKNSYLNGGWYLVFQYFFQVEELKTQGAYK